jgi:nitrate reductase (cytochrome), electron transfer subunit
MMRRRLAPLALVLLLAGPAALAQRLPDAPRLTGPEPFTEETPAPPLRREMADDLRRQRNYPDQPPVIPHSIRGYQIDLNANRCMTCHARQYTELSQAPMISITHYMDRDGNFLAGLAPRRYNCTACHVPQTTANPLVENEFTDMLELTGPDEGSR